MGKAVLGLFTYVDDMLAAADKLKKSGFSGITIFSPIPLGHEIEHVLGERKNYVKYFTFLGGVTGFFFGTLLAFGTAALYILPRGGRAIFAVTPTLIISYETTILIGVFFTMLGFMLFAKLPSYKKKIYDPEVSIDSFGLLVDVSEAEINDVTKTLKELGANEVKTVEEK
jgi:molybdopterin-containing oxidoreductase family membrane subunit